MTDHTDIVEDLKWLKDILKANFFESCLNIIFQNFELSRYNYI